MSIHSDLTFRSIVIVPGRRFNVKDKGIGAILLAAYGVFFSVGCHLSFEVAMASRLVFSPVLWMCISNSNHGNLAPLIACRWKRFNKLIMAAFLL